MATITRTERHARTVERTLAQAGGATTRRAVEHALAWDGQAVGRRGATWREVCDVVGALISNGVIVEHPAGVVGEVRYELRVGGGFYRERFENAVQAAEWAGYDEAPPAPLYVIPAAA